jgi:hypothetical protein
MSHSESGGNQGASARPTKASCQRAASKGGLGRKMRDTNPFPVMIYNALAEVEDIKIGFETKLK